MLDYIVAEPIGEDLPGEWRNSDAGGFALENIAEVLKVGVAPAHGRVLELEERYVGPANNFVVGVHGTRGAVGLGVFDLLGSVGVVKERREKREKGAR